MNFHHFSNSSISTLTYLLRQSTKRQQPHQSSQTQIPNAKMQFKTLLSIYVAIVGAVAADTDDPLSQLPTCAKAKLTAAFEATGCTSQTG